MLKLLRLIILSEGDIEFLINIWFVVEGGISIENEKKNGKSELILYILLGF